MAVLKVKHKTDHVSGEKYIAGDQSCMLPESKFLSRACPKKQDAVRANHSIWSILRHAFLNGNFSTYPGSIEISEGELWV